MSLAVAMRRATMQFEKPAAEERKRKGGEKGRKKQQAAREGKVACGIIPQATSGEEAPASEKARDRAAKVAAEIG